MSPWAIWLTSIVVDAQRMALDSAPVRIDEGCGPCGLSSMVLDDNWRPGGGGSG